MSETPITGGGDSPPEMQPVAGSGPIDLPLFLQERIEAVEKMMPGFKFNTTPLMSPRDKLPVLDPEKSRILDRKLLTAWDIPPWLVDVKYDTWRDRLWWRARLLRKVGWWIKKRIL